jgi:hypothetical protein
MNVWAMAGSAVTFVTGLLLNIVTIGMHRGMPVPWGGRVGQRIDSRHVVGFARFGDNIHWPLRYWTSMGDWLLLGGGLVLWLSASVYCVDRYRKRIRSMATEVHPDSYEIVERSQVPEMEPWHQP